MFGHLGIDLDIIHTTRFEAAFLHVCPGVHRELSCEIVPAHTVYSGADVDARVPNSLTGQVLEARPDWPVLVDVDDWTRLTWVVRSGLDWSRTSLYKRSHESHNGTQANTP